MTAKKSSGFVNPMALVQRVKDEAGTEPQTLEAQPESVPAVKPPALPSSTVPAKKAKEEMPWVNAHPKVRVHFGLRMSQRLHLKFEYAAQHTLQASMQTFALQALEEAVDRRLKELGVI